MSHSRYAVYLAPPPDSDLWRFGCDVVGRDALTGRSVSGFSPDGHDGEAWRKLTSDPRRYGFHATLKAPFVLRADLDFVDLTDTMAAFARDCAPFDAGDLHGGEMKTGDGRAFVVLKPRGAAKELRALEEKTVRALDDLRAPLTDAERRRRNLARLTPRQRYYLEAWGYPYLIDEFRPHFTLTNAVADAGPAARALEREFRLRVASPALRVDALTLFGERESDGEFEVMRSFPLGHGKRAKRSFPRVAAGAFID